MERIRRLYNSWTLPYIFRFAVMNGPHSVATWTVSSIFGETRMLPGAIQPKNLYHLIDNIDDYAAFSRQCDSPDQVSDELKIYVWEYLRAVPLDQTQLKILAACLTDLIYRYANTTLKLDALIRPYLASVIGYTFDRLRDRGIDVFYILDNDFSTREDRFQLTAMLFEASGFAVVSPHKLWHGFAQIEEPEDRHKRLLLTSTKLEMQPTDNSTLSYDEVVDIIDHNMQIPVGVVYIEKNADVNYLAQIRQLVGQTRYTLVMRNEGVSSKNFQILE